VQPCLRAELLLVTVDTHTGALLCHVPQYNAPLVPEIQVALNTDRSRLPLLISELRYGTTFMTILTVKLLHSVTVKLQFNN
jgi:mediator of RNA polymerase II transcription subunit 14